jgi:MarR family 2-MHQ and catechol resistance regulon transcriptional repressor
VPDSASPAVHRRAAAPSAAPAPEGVAADATPRRPDVGPAERDALKLWVVLSRAHAAIAARAAADVARHDLTLAEFGVLEALYHKGRMLLGEVQRSLLVSSGGVTYLVDRLERRGLVRREACPEDRRARYAALTDEGTAFVRAAFPAHAAAVHDTLGALTRDEQREAARLLKRLGLGAADSVDRGARPGPRRTPRPDASR